MKKISLIIFLIGGFVYADDTNIGITCKGTDHPMTETPVILYFTPGNSNSMIGPEGIESAFGMPTYTIKSEKWSESKQNCNIQIEIEESMMRGHSNKINLTLSYNYQKDNIAISESKNKFLPKGSQCAVHDDKMINLLKTCNGHRKNQSKNSLGIRADDRNSVLGFPTTPSGTADDLVEAVKYMQNR